MVRVRLDVPVTADSCAFTQLVWKPPGSNVTTSRASAVLGVSSPNANPGRRQRPTGLRVWRVVARKTDLSLPPHEAPNNPPKGLAGRLYRLVNGHAMVAPFLKEK